MDTWWIDNPHLLGSPNPTLADLEQLRRDGFEVLISLLKDAIARVREARRHAVETREQEAALREFAAKRRGLV